MPAIWPDSPSRENDIMMMSCSLQIFIPAFAVSSVYFEKLPIYPAEKNLNFKKTLHKTNTTLAGSNINEVLINANTVDLYEIWCNIRFDKRITFVCQTDPQYLNWLANLSVVSWNTSITNWAWAVITTNTNKTYLIFIWSSLPHKSNSILKQIFPAHLHSYITTLSETNKQLNNP